MGLIDEPDPLVTAQQHLLDDLAEEAGGYDVLDSLDNAPLPGEGFAWESVPADIRAQVAAVLDQCDQGADELLGLEYRTACRRLLARAAPGIPGTSLASARPELVAAAVCWVIGRSNHRFGTRPGDLKVKDLTGFGCGYRCPFWLGTADASVIAVPKRLSATHVATIDHRHFRAVRPAHCAAFELLPSL